MTVRSSTPASSSGWDRLQTLFDQFRAEQEQTERFLADALEGLTHAALNAPDAPPAVDMTGWDACLEKLIAAGEQNRAAVREACQATEAQAARFAEATAEGQRREAELLAALQKDREALQAAELAAQSQVEQLTDTIRKGFEELLNLTRQRASAEEAFQASLAATFQQERAATEQAIQNAVGEVFRQYEAASERALDENRAAMAKAAQEQRTAAAEAVQAAVTGALDHVVGHAMEEQSALLAKGLEQHRSMMGLAVEALRSACDGAPADGKPAGENPFSLASESGTEASHATGTAADSRAAPVGDAVLNSLRAQYQLVQRQNARRRQSNPESGN